MDQGGLIVRGTTLDGLIYGKDIMGVGIEINVAICSERDGRIVCGK